MGDDSRYDALIAANPDPLAEVSGKRGEVRAARRQWIQQSLRAHGREQPLRVLIATAALGVGGSEYQVLRVIPVLKSLGIEVEHLYYGADHSLLKAYQHRGIVSHFIDRDAMGRWRFFRTMTRFLRQQRYDVVHTFIGRANGYVGVPAALARVPVQIGGWRNRTPESGQLGRCVFSLTNWPRSAWVVNATTNMEYVGRLAWQNRTRAYVVPNGLELEPGQDVPNTGNWPELTEWVNDRQVVGMVSNVNIHKQLDRFLDLAERIHQQRKNVCFVHIGRKQSAVDDSWDRAQQRIRDKQMEGYLWMRGPRDNVAELLPQMTVFVLTSRHEGCPNVVLEAMRAARPVVMTHSCDTREFLIEGETGYRVKVGDLDALTDRVLSLLDDPARAEAMGRRAREIIEQRFTAEQSGWVLARVYLREWESWATRKS